MKRSLEEHVIQGFPNELVLHHIIGTDVKVMALLAQTSHQMRAWLDNQEQPNLYFTLFKHNFKNEYCLLYDLLVNSGDVSTIFDELQSGDEDDAYVHLGLTFSCSMDDKFIEHHPVDAEFILNAPFSRLIQYYHPYAGTFKEDMTEELYEKFCTPYDPLIIESCQRDPNFASKMARLYNTVIHPCGYPNASYYMTYQSDMRQLMCRMLRIIELCSIDENDDYYYDLNLVLGYDKVGDDASILRDSLIYYIAAADHDELAEKLKWSEKSEEEAWGEEDENGVSTMECGVRTQSFINLLHALPETQLPPKKDALTLYKWWQENVNPELEKMPHYDSKWHIEEEPRWHTNNDVLYFDVIDDALYRTHLETLFAEHKEKGEDIFHLLLYRLLKYPLRPCNYIRGSNPHLTDRS